MTTLERRCLFDPGHGGKFSGAVVNDPLKGEIMEKDINLKAASLIGHHLTILSEHDRKGRIYPYYTREGDHNLGDTVTDDLDARVEMSDLLEADCFISVHANKFHDPGVHGFEVFTSVGETEADPLADTIMTRVELDHPEIKLRADLSDGDMDKEEMFYVLRKTKCPAVLIELDFISNPQGLSNLTSDAYLSDLCASIARGISTWFNT